ncbi:hypothetical protein [Dinghuibacter silviterrae]|uniref:N-acetyltransferase domain-containing protein n=1 Tax=Dinghuibacter silviterrae TaxID=1539049 RepID=A0A4R8DQ34_9BACT|nr:hypothetical protein [Dinghuibacter silviterrae]TDX00232.1 hypothetical protein EDB95_1251 [Dinghuibacter silviterrae]
MQLIEVLGKDTARAFMEVNEALNRGNPKYIRPLDKDIEDVFDPAKNKAYRQGTCIRWLLQDASGKYIGRIAAFVNKKYKNKGDEQPTGGMGFFDCIDDQAAANLLLDAARDWLYAQGMEAMDGPINFGERDRWWGLITQGFHEPMYGMNFNPPYYKTLLENYGFRPFFDQICFSMKVKDPLQEKFYKRHAELSKQPGLSARHIQKDQLDKYATDFVTVYNKAWKSHGGGKDLHRDQARAMFRKMKPVLDERLIWFVYHDEDPIACWINIPELNQYFRHFHGRLGLLEKLRFVYLKWRGACTKFTGLVFGVIPEWQGRGVDAYLIVEGAKVVQRPDIPYVDYEMQWIGDFNPKMINVAESLGTYRSRVLTTYRFLFDRTKTVKRHPILE